MGEEHPEVITDADKEVWRHLGTGSRSVVSSYTSSSKPPLRPPSVLSRPIVAAPVDLLQSSPQRQLGTIQENPRAGLLKGEILEKVTVKPEPEIGPLDLISNVDLASGNRQLLDSGFTAFQKPSKHPWGRRWNGIWILLYCRKFRVISWGNDCKSSTCRIQIRLRSWRLSRNLKASGVINYGVTSPNGWNLIGNPCLMVKTMFRFLLNRGKLWNITFRPLLSLMTALKHGWPLSRFGGQLCVGGGQE